MVGNFVTLAVLSFSDPGNVEGINPSGTPLQSAFPHEAAGGVRRNNEASG